MTMIAIVALAACGFSSAVLCLRSLRVLYRELSQQDGDTDRQTVLIALGMLALALVALWFVAALAF